MSDRGVRHGRAMTEGGERSIWVVAIRGNSNALRDPLGSKFQAQKERGTLS